MQVDSLPTEISGKPCYLNDNKIRKAVERAETVGLHALSVM